MIKKIPTVLGIFEKDKVVLYNDSFLKQFSIRNETQEDVGIKF